MGLITLDDTAQDNGLALMLHGLLEENLAAASVELTPHDLAEIETAAAGIQVHGARYSEGSQRLVDR